MDTSTNQQGPPEERSSSFPKVYDELRALASGYLRRQRRNHTLQPTALVHEAFMRLLRHESTTLGAGKDLVRLAASAMRSVLVDHARRRGANKRSAEGHRVELDDGPSFDVAPGVDLVALDEALNRLAQLEPQWRVVIELRFFGGCTEEETAELLSINIRTVQRQWRMAKAWLRNELGEGPEHDS